MPSDYVATLYPDLPEPLDPTEISRADPTELARLLSEWCRRDLSLRRRLRDLLATAPQLTPIEPDPASAFTGDGGGPSASYMVGASPAMMRVFDSVRRYAASSAPVLITGESGTGKELVARAIHERSSWKKGPFVAINCGALPTTLIGSELFGYEKGAFTGATARKIGRIEAAEGGTVFLDEIGDLPFETQVHLLRFLQESTIERIGGGKPITINARVIAATNVNLREAVAHKRFREDLFYRLHVLTLSLPPLRERGSDLGLLTRFFLKRFSEEMGRERLELSPEAERYIITYPWPGNVRELIACLRRAVVMADGAAIEVADLGLSDPAREELDPDRGGLDKARGEAEASLVRTTLERNHFNIKKSAHELNVSRVTLYRLIQKHEIVIDRGGARR